MALELKRTWKTIRLNEGTHLLYAGQAYRFHTLKHWPKCSMKTFKRTKNNSRKCLLHQVTSVNFASRKTHLVRELVLLSFRRQRWVKSLYYKLNRLRQFKSNLELQASGTLSCPTFNSSKSFSCSFLIRSSTTYLSPPLQVMSLHWEQYQIRWTYSTDAWCCQARKTSTRWG